MKRKIVAFGLSSSKRQTVNITDTIGLLMIKKELLTFCRFFSKARRVGSLQATWVSDWTIEAELLLQRHTASQRTVGVESDTRQPQPVACWPSQWEGVCIEFSQAALNREECGLSPSFSCATANSRKEILRTSFKVNTFPKSKINSNHMFLS